MNLKSQGSQLVDAAGLLQILFPENSRPCLRWLREQQKRRTIPFIKLGHLVFFDLEEVRVALRSQHTIQPK